MKKLFFSLLATGAFSLPFLAVAQTPVTSPVQVVPTNTADPNAINPVTAAPLPTTTIEFSELTFDFGDIKQGDVVNHIYKFKNTGTNPAKIENVKPGCGCTASDYTKEEVPPGGEGYVKLEFNSAYKSGMQSKSATVTYNGEPKVIVLSFRANILVPPPPPAPPAPAGN